MVDIRRVEVLWTGLTGMPGLSVFYSADAVDACAEIKAFFNTIKGQFPAPLAWVIPGSGDKIDVATGTLTGGWTSANGGTITSSSSGSYEGGNGAFVKWGTALIIGGRRLKGRTFLVPCKSDQFDSNGVPSAACIAIIQPAINTLVSAGKLEVWHRPDPPSSSTGVSSTITSGELAAMATHLRTRRT